LDINGYSYQHWCSVAGLAFDLLGAVMIVEAGHVSQRRAKGIEHTTKKNVGRRKAGGPDELAAVLDLMVLTSGKTMRGFVLVIIGSAFQIVGAWPF
jgi:hypothetical protein